MSYESFMVQTSI